MAINWDKAYKEIGAESTPSSGGGINWDAAYQNIGEKPTTTPNKPDLREGEYINKEGLIVPPPPFEIPTKTPLSQSRYNTVGQSIIPRYQEDNPLAAAGKDIVNYGAGTLLRGLGGLGQAGMQLVSNIGNAVQGKPLDFSQKSLKQDILPKQYSQAVDTLASKGALGQLASGFIQGGVEGGLTPETYIGGMGIIDDLTKLGLAGKSATLGTAENLAANAATGQRAVKGIAPSAQSATKGYLNAERNALKKDAIKTPDIIYGKGTGSPQQLALPAAKRDTFTQVKYSIPKNPKGIKWIETEFGNIPVKSKSGEGAATTKATLLPKKPQQALFSENLIDRPFVKAEATKKPLELKPSTNIQPIKKAAQNGAQRPDINIVSSVNKKPKGGLSRLYNTTVDNTSFIGKTSGEEGKIATTAARNAGGTVEYSLKNGLVNMEGKKIVDKGMEEIYNLPKEQQGKLDELLFHQHNIDRIKQGKQLLDYNITSADSQKAVNDILKQYPNLKVNADEVRKTLDSLLDEWGVKSGLVSPELRDTLKSIYKNYVPGYRKLGGVDALSTKSRGMGPAKIINKAVGGDDPLITLKESIPMLINKTIKASKKNEVYKTILSAVRKNPDNGYASILEPVGKIEEVVDKKLTDAMLESVRADGLEAIATLSDKALEADAKLGYLLTVMENGKPVKLRVSEDLFNSLKSLDKVDDTSLNKALQALKKYGTNPFKSLITGYNPLFALKNISRDIPTAFIQGTENNPLKFVKNLYEAGKDMATKAERYQEYKAIGGQGGNYFNVERGISPTGKLERLKKGIGAFNNATETLPRYGEYLGTLKREGADYAGKMKGLYNAQEVTTNFGRHGDLTKSIDAIVPYLNPAVQGIDKFARSMKKPANIAKAIGVVTVPTTALYLINQAVDKKGYDQLDNRTKDTNYLIPQGNGQFIKIPKSRETGVLFGALFERIARTVEGQKEPFKGFGTTVATNFAPQNPFENNIFAPATWNLATNKDFANRTIVPQSMQDRSPRYQYDEKTSEISKAIGDKFNLSPKQIDYLIKSYTGVVGQFVLPATTKSTYGDTGVNLTKPLFSPFTADALYNNEILNNFYSNLDKLTAKATDRNFLENIPSKAVTPEEAIKNRFLKASKQITDLNKRIKQLETSVAPDKQKQIREVKQQILDIASVMNASLRN